MPAMQSVEILRTFKALEASTEAYIRADGSRTKRTVFVAVEVTRPGTPTAGKKHVMAIESDGGFTPAWIRLDMRLKTKPSIRKYRELFRPYNVWNFTEEYADILPSRSALCGPVVDSQRYFDYHRSGHVR